MIKAILYFDGKFPDAGIDKFLMRAAAKVCATIQGKEFSIDKAVIDGYSVHWGYFDSPTYVVNHLDSEWGESSLYNVAYSIQKENIMTGNLLLTNSTFLLNFDRFTWDEEKQEFKVWFWNEHLQEFRHINDLTKKDLRKAHNIVKLYHNGALDIRPKWREYDDED